MCYFTQVHCCLTLPSVYLANVKADDQFQCHCTKRADKLAYWAVEKHWSDESRFLLHHANGRVRIWCKQHESRNPSCQMSIDQAVGGRIMVLGVFSWHTLAPLIPMDGWLDSRVYLSIEQVHHFMVAVNPMAEGHYQQDNAPWDKGHIVMYWFQGHYSEITWLPRPSQSPDPNPIEHLGTR